MGLTYGDIFADWEMAVAKRVVSRFKSRNNWLKGLDFEDLLQECVTCWYRNRGKYQAGRGTSERTFMEKVISTRLQGILREQLADRRKAFHLAESLNQMQTEDEPALLEVDPANEDFFDLNLRLEIGLALRSLTPLQREICDLLGQDYPVKQIAEMLGRPRSTIRDGIQRIKQIFIRRNLQNY